MLKRVICIAVCAVMMLSAVGVVAEDLPINVVIDGEAVEFTDFYGFPVLENSRILLPFRQIFEMYGWTAYYEEETESIFGIKGDDTLAMQIGSTTYISNRGNVEFDVAPIIVNSRTMVPIRVISEILGFTVGYEEATNTVLIDTSTGF